MELIVRQVPVGPILTNCYVVGCPETRQAMIVDPGWDASQILAVVREEGLQVKWVVNTHAHWDHMGANADIIEATGATLALHPKDLPLLKAHGGALLFQIPIRPSPLPDHDLADGEVLEVGTLRFQVLFTPGHTPGHVSFYEAQHGVLFDGDVLFKEGIGRTDLPGGDYWTLMDSIRTKLMTLPDSTQVYSGHGEVTTIGNERWSNPFLS